MCCSDAGGGDAADAARGAALQDGARAHAEHALLHVQQRTAGPAARGTVSHAIFSVSK